MYAVIFRAEINVIDAVYTSTAKRLRELAMNEYGCTEFTACLQGNTEIAISYWPDRAHIHAWKHNLEHQRAQLLGKTKWYKNYQVQIVKVLNTYGSNAA